MSVATTKERVCANPDCGKAFVPKKVKYTTRFCSQACSRQMAMQSINGHKALTPGKGASGKPLPVITAAELADLEVRLKAIRRELGIAEREEVDNG